MYKNIKWSTPVLTLLVFIALESQALANCEINGANEFLELIKKNHPSINFNAASERSVNNSLDVAKQVPNPEFGANVVKGNSVDGSFTTTSLSIQHTFELGGKRDSRIDLARKFITESKNKLRGSNEDIIIDSVVKAYRLRQVYDLLPIYDEAYRAVGKILKIKERRKSLSPEEQVEKETLVLATNDYKLKVARLISERVNLSRHLSFFLGKNCSIPKKALPRKVDLSQKFSNAIEYSRYSKLQVAKSGVQLAQSRLGLAESERIPDLKIGPTFENESVRGKTYQSFGVALTMDLPIFNTNRGGRAQSTNELLKARVHLLNVEREASLDLQSWIDKYDAFRSSLKLSANQADLERKHQKIETLFKRGIISTSMVIESHRQLIEFANTRYEFELGAVEALWNVYKLNGTVLDKTL